MKKLNFLAAILLLPLIAFAQIKTGNAFTVRVRIANAAKNALVYLAYQFDGKEIIDSAIQKNGLYTFSGTIDRPLDATLVTDYEGLGIQEMEKRRSVADFFQFYIHPGTISLKTDKLIKNATISGSVINADNERLKAMLKPINDQLANIKSNEKALIAKTPMCADDSIKIRALRKQRNSLLTASEGISKKFILENPDSYVALTELWSYGGSFPDLTVIEPMYNRLSASVRNTPFGQEYHKFLYDYKYLAAGAKAPDFTQNDVNGNPVSLSSFKGKYVLLDFWASWCGPCRADNPQLIKVFNDFKGKNFTILGISLDKANDKNAWLKAIADDGLRWTQVSDLKHWDNSVAKLYSIRAIPQSFLIDPDGVIVAKGLNPKELRKKLNEILPE